MGPPMGERPTVFVSYSQRDKSWAERLVEHLAVLTRQGILDVWLRDQAEGSPARSRDEAIRDASVAVLLITQTYLNDKAIWEEETEPLLKRKQSGGLSVIPVLIE